MWWIVNMGAAAGVLDTPPPPPSSPTIKPRSAFRPPPSTLRPPPSALHPSPSSSLSTLQSAFDAAAAFRSSYSTHPFPTFKPQSSDPLRAPGRTCPSTHQTAPAMPPRTAYGTAPQQHYTPHHPPAPPTRAAAAARRPPL